MKIIYPESIRPAKVAEPRPQRRVQRPLWPSAPWNWKTIKNNGRCQWQVNIYSGKRRMIVNELACGYQPIDHIWLNGGELEGEKMVLWT